MRPSLSMFFTLPLPIRAVILLASGGGIMMLLFMLMGQGVLAGQLGFLLLVILALGAAIMAGFSFVTKKIDKRKGKPFEQKVADNAASAPQGVSDPGSRAKLDDLRKKFDEGIQVFKDYGKDLYTMPWYVIVGEPGSGKTEAMRHSNVGFPPGLQNQLQGVGGTVNMHWWFTMDAVMIDTAGRLMFEEVEPGQTSEWVEFLKLLRTARPNCPLNGMMLVIPADSLIKDTADEIERKGSKIAQQLDQIQRALGVRFPVFVVISKADLINGFREFFDEITDPVAAMQMLGWSNPNDLDTPFDPSLVEQHLRTVRERLIRRRFALLSDPVHTDDPMGRRIDQVDALYALPDSLVKLAPRLRRYLEMVFVAGAWSADPLFLRGIYFTSSMRENDALDADLAEALSIPVEALPEGRAWERERAFFLRDVFKEKVFRERGLVTRKKNVGKSRRNRSMIMALAAALSVAVIGGWTAYSLKALRDSVGRHEKFWKDVAAAAGKASDSSANRLRTASEGYYADGANIAAWRFSTTFDIAGVESRLGLHEKAKALADESFRPPWIFRLADVLTEDVPSTMQSARRELFGRLVVGAFLDHAKRQLSETEGEWGATQVAAMKSLIEIQSADLKAPSGPATAEEMRAWLASFGALHDEDKQASWTSFLQGDDLDRYTALMVDLYGTNADQFARAFRVGQPEELAGLSTLLADLSTSWSGNVDALGFMSSLNAAAAEYASAEQRVIAYPDLAKANSVEDFEAALAEWLTRMEALDKAKATLDGLVLDGTGLSRFGLMINGKSVDTIKSDVRTDAERAIRDTFEPLIAAFPSAPDSEDAKLDERATALEKMRSSLAGAMAKKLEDNGSAVDAAFASERNESRTKVLGVWQENKHDYSRHYEYLAQVRQAVVQPGSGSPAVDVSKVDLFGLSGWLQTFNARVAEAERLAPVSVVGATEPAALASGLVAQSGVQVIEAFGKYGRTRAVQRVLGGSTEIAQQVELRAAESPQRWPTVPLINGTEPIDVRYDPRFAKDMIRTSEMLAGLFAAQAGTETYPLPALSENWTNLNQAFRTYRENYKAYWMNDACVRLQVPVASGWNAWSATHQSFQASNACDALLLVTQKVLDAIEPLPADETLDAYRQALRRDESNLKTNSEFWLKAQRTRDAWKELLDQTPDRALTNFRNAYQSGGETWKTTYLGVMPEGGARTPAGTYWTGYVSACMNAMANEQTQANRSSLSLLMDARKAPFVRSAGGARVESMSKQEFDAAVAAVSQLGKPTAPGSSAGVSLPVEIERLRKEVMGETSAISVDQRPWFNSLAKIASALGKADAPAKLTVSFSANGTDQLPGNAQLNPIPYMVQFKGAIDRQILFRDLPTATFDLPLPATSGEALTVSLYADLGGQQRIASGTAPNVWHLLQTYLTSSAEPETLDGGSVIKLPLDNGQTLTVRITLPAGLPTWEEWPTTSEWPSN